MNYKFKTINYSLQTNGSKRESGDYRLSENDVVDEMLRKLPYKIHADVIYYCLMISLGSCNDAHRVSSLR